MKITDLEVGMWVHDLNDIDHPGIVAEVKKTVAYINFTIGGEPRKYDAAHCQFLREEKRNVGKTKRRSI